MIDQNTQPKATRLFAFLDLDHPAVAWAVMRGQFVSADSAPGSIPGIVSFMVAAMIRHQSVSRLLNEEIIEQVRRVGFPHCASRIRGMYFFASRSEAEARIGDKDWPSYFIEDNLLELELSHSSSLTKVDANWITYAPTDGDGLILRHDVQWIESYWSGEVFREVPIWEIIVQGVAVVVDIEKRRRCRDFVGKEFPKSTPFIEMSRLASEVGSHGGLIVPFLRHLSDEVYELCYLLREAEFKNSEVIDKIREHPDAGKLPMLWHETDTVKVPDFRPYGFTFRRSPLNP